MARRSFDSMLANIDQGRKATPSPAPEKAKSARAAQPKPAKKKAEPSGLRDGLSYKDLERKEVRLRGEQFDALTALQRRLNRERNHEGHRITENTLIRLGIDLLLEQTDVLTGTTESELARSLKLPS